MSCSKTLGGIQASCDTNLGGIKTAWFANFGEVSISGQTGHTVSLAFTPADTGVTKMVKYEFAKQTGSLTSTQVRNDQNGTNYYTNAIHLVFSKMEASKHIEVSALAEGRLTAVILDTNGKYWVVGLDTYVSSDGSEIASTGVNFDDMNGYTIDLSCMEGHLFYEVANPSAILDGVSA